MINEYFLYYDHENYWKLSGILDQKHPSTTPSSIRSDEKGLVYLPKKGWRFFDGSNWILNEDLSLSIGDPAYPETLSISTLHSDGENNSLVGNYGLLQKKTFKSRPVWKKTNSTGFFSFLVCFGK